MRFSLTHNTLLGATLLIAELFAQSSDQLDGRTKGLTALISTAAAAAVAQLAHRRNPDGSRANRGATKDQGNAPRQPSAL